MENNVGQRLGQYSLLQLLGRGGFASVYLGQHVDLGTQVAVKVFSAPTTHDSQEQILTEARTYARLDHPHILRMFEYGLAQDTPYLVMHYAPGGTLQARHPLGSILPLERIIFYTRQIAVALQYAHDQKVVHRDVKPANMLLGAHNEVLLSDFGIAIAAHSTRSLSPQLTAGTVRYMAPEQAIGQARVQSDQYALAVCVYEWIAGEPPFQGKSLIEILLKHRETLPRSLLQRRTVLDIEDRVVLTQINTVIMQALAKDPKARFSCILDFAQALETIVAESIPIKAGTTLTLSRPHAGGIYTLAFSPDGKSLATGGEDATVQLSESATGTHLFTYLGHSRRVSSLAFSPDGTRVASSSDDTTVQVWETATGTCLLTYRGHTKGVEALAWSPDGHSIVSSSLDKTVQVWDMADGRTRLTYHGHDDGLTDPIELPGLCWSPDGRRIASGGEDKQVQIWDAMTGQRLLTLRCPNLVQALAFSPDGTRIACALFAPPVQIWDTSTGQIRRTYREHPQATHCIAWSSDGRFCATGGHEHHVHLWNARTGTRIMRYRVHPDFLTALAFSPDGMRIASASADGTLCIWRAHT